MSFSNRLARLEKATASSRAAAAAGDQRATEQDSHLQAAWAIMQQTMSEEHARLVVEAYSAGAQYIQSSEYNTPAGRLLRRCLDALSRLGYRHWPYTDIPDEVILAMPPVLADVYLAQEELPLHECEDCGCHLPSGHFKGCPLCGGRIGWYAYYNRRKAEADAASGHRIR